MARAKTKSSSKKVTEKVSSKEVKVQEEKSSKPEPKKAEPKKAEPKKAEPKKAEPKKAEPEKIIKVSIGDRVSRRSRLGSVIDVMNDEAGNALKLTVVWDSGMQYAVSAASVELIK